jgi:hypothetical protein
MAAEPWRFLKRRWAPGRQAGVGGTAWVTGSPHPDLALPAPLPSVRVRLLHQEEEHRDREEQPAERQHAADAGPSRP